MSKQYLVDAPAALGFVVHQRTHIESEVLKKPYPAIRYSELVPVDTSANQWAASITHFTQDAVGRAKFVNGKGDDIPLVNLVTSKFELGVNMAGVGYSFSLEEIGAAQAMGTNLSSDGADAARLAYEQFVDEVTLAGDPTLAIEGLFNTTGVTSAAAAQTFAAGTPQQILATINTAISTIMTQTQGVEMADTVILPIAQFADIATRIIDVANSMTILEFVQKSNVYTVSTGRPLKITAHHRLTGKMVVYRRDPAVLKLNMPMPLQFIPPQFVNLEVKVLGMFRFAPLSIRRPLAMRYVTAI
jgi:hypothetical protein